MKTTPWEVKLSDAYIAGFLDGDGSIVAIVTKTYQRRFPHRVKLRVNFTQKTKDKFILDLIRKSLNNYGAVRTSSRYNVSELVIGNRQEVKDVLKRLLKFVVVKRNQLDIALQIIGVFDQYGAGARRVFLTEKEYAKVMALAKRIRKINSNTGSKLI